MAQIEIQAREKEGIKILDVSGKLTVGGTAVLLTSVKGPTHPKVIPADPGTWSGQDAGQRKLTAV